MGTPDHRASHSRLLGAFALALAAALVLTLPAAAFNKSWTKPRLIFKSGSAPTHAMVTDAAGKVHVAVEQGASGVWYVTDRDGSWTSCRVSSGNDRAPSIAVDGTTVHIAFARQTAGQAGVYTASSDQPAGGGCGWAITQRSFGAARDTALGAHEGRLSLVFQTGSRKLKYFRGAAGASEPWATRETIDHKCCTSRPTLELTSFGGPRVAYGDGTRRTEGLKYAWRTKTGWKKDRVHRGRTKSVALNLDQSPPLFGGPPSNRPALAFIVKDKGLFFAAKQRGWQLRPFGRAGGPVDLTVFSNVTQIVFMKKGDIHHLRSSGGIWFATRLSRSGSEAKPVFHGDKLTYSHKTGTKGVYFSRPT